MNQLWGRLSSLPFLQYSGWQAGKPAPHWCLIFVKILGCGCANFFAIVALIEDLLGLALNAIFLFV
jgi:hypothetical protein